MRRRSRGEFDPDRRTLGSCFRRAGGGNISGKSAELSNFRCSWSCLHHEFGRRQGDKDGNDVQEKSTLQEALATTERIFLQAQAIPLRFGGANPVWGVYDRVHLEVSLPLALRGVSIDQAEAGRFLAERDARRPGKLGGFVRHFPFFLYSLVSIAWLMSRPGKRAGIWTGDFYDGRTGGDFRLGNFYRHLDDLGAAHVDLIRTHTGGVWKAMRNAWRRRRPAIYCDSLACFLAFRPSLGAFNLSGIKDAAARRVFFLYRNEIADIQASAGLLRRLLPLLNVRALVAWEFSSRQAAAILAAKERAIPVIGFMHAAGMQPYMAHEFIPAAAGDIGPDVYGVWSRWWQEYYLRNAGIYGQFAVSGPMRPPTATRKPVRPLPLSGPLKVLWISEPLLNPEEAAPWLRHLCAQHHVSIKKRPSVTDRFYQGLMRAFPEFGGLGVVEGDIFEAARNADIVLGSHSTAVIDASLVGTPFLLVRTHKWGDYFELSGFESPYALYVPDVDALETSLAHLRASGPGDVLSAIRERFYGDEEKDGSLWAAQRTAASLKEEL
jgi:hypothetical protein